MSLRYESRRSALTRGIYGLLDPLPFGFFVAALIFDIVYFRGGNVLWQKGAAWLIAFGLVIAIVPRLINLAEVWITSRAFVARADRIDFWLNLIAIIAAIFNAFVHSRDAYGVMPTGLWLSICTVALMSLGRILVAVDRSADGSFAHD
jgi:uncharacterized membrane protein